MGLFLKFRQELHGAWETARAAVEDNFDSLIAQLQSLGPLRENLSDPYPASSVLVTDGSGIPSLSRVLPGGLGLGSNTTSVTRSNGSTILPTAQNLQAAIAIKKPVTGSGLGASFFTTSADDWTSAGPQGLESYLVSQGSGTTKLSIGLIGNMEHAGTGTMTDVRSIQGGGIITNTGGGTDFRCFFAAPSGRAFGGTGTFTNGYGFVCSSFGNGFTNKYAFYSADTVAGIFLGSDTAVKSTTNTWQVSSDRRLKQNIRPFTEGLEVLERIEPVNYELNEKTFSPGRPGVSVIAQDVSAVLPEHLRRIMVGEQDIDGEKYLTWDSGPLIYIVINAIKEILKRLVAIERAVHGR